MSPASVKGVEILEGIVVLAMSDNAEVTGPDFGVILKTRSRIVARGGSMNRQADPGCMVLNEVTLPK